MRLCRVLLPSAVVLASCRAPVTLHAPVVAPSEARELPARVELDPIAMTPNAVTPFAMELKPPPPNVVLTSAITGELNGRSLRGRKSGERYTARCTLDRFAVRTQGDLAATHTLATLYVDLACDAVRASDRVLVFSSELRARSAATATTVLSTDTGLVQRMVDRMMADASRELASDLAVRALGLTSDPSHRVFVDPSTQGDLAGLDDTPHGTTALLENPTVVPAILAATRESDALARASAWNVAALAAGPGDPWLGGERLKLDDDPFVRFYQYKTLARIASATAIAELKGAADRESEPLLTELLRDAIASGGIGLPRAQR